MIAHLAHDCFKDSTHPGPPPEFSDTTSDFPPQDNDFSAPKTSFPPHLEPILVPGVS